MNMDFWKDTGLRCAWTFAEAMLSCMTIGQAITDINWMHALSISAVAAIYTFLKQIIRLAKENTEEVGIGDESVLYGIDPADEENDEEVEDDGEDS